MKISIKDFFRKCDQIRRKLQSWSHLLKKSLMEDFIFCAVSGIKNLWWCPLERVDKYNKDFAPNDTFKKKRIKNMRFGIIQILVQIWFSGRLL